MKGYARVVDMTMQQLVKTKTSTGVEGISAWLNDLNEKEGWTVKHLQVRGGGEWALQAVAVLERPDF